MTHKVHLIVAGFLLSAGTAMAEPAPRPKTEVLLISASCADLRNEVRAARAECAPKARTVSKKPFWLTLASDTAPSSSRKKLTRMPWMIGVFQ